MNLNSPGPPVKPQPFQTQPLAKLQTGIGRGYRFMSALQLLPASVPLLFFSSVVRFFHHKPANVYESPSTEVKQLDTMVPEVMVMRNADADAEEVRGLWVWARV